MPDVLVRSKTQEWKELSDYFNGVAHHNQAPAPVDFSARVEALELFLLDHLEPRTFADQDVIDELITEGEKPDDR